MKISEFRLGFIGFGHMAQIILQSLLDSALISRSQILFTQQDVDKMKESEKRFGITATTLETLVQKSDVLLLCVRPQQVKKVIDDLQKIGLKKQRIISILAGVKIAYFKKYLPTTPLLRAMPNVCSEVIEGMTTLSFDKGIDPDFVSFSHLLFKSMGKIVELPEEKMDLATAIAGSGPAFVLSLIESVSRFAEKEGICYEVAKMMVAQMFLGTSKLALQSKNELTDLINGIAVPNGTTEAGLKAFFESDLGVKFQSTFNAAFKRAKELSE